MKQHDQLWWASLDGELTPAEAAQLDRSLSDADRNRMSGEMEMERKLGEALAQPVPGADQAWQAALAKVKAQEAAQRGTVRLRRRIAWIAAPLAVAAAALVILSVGYLRTEAPQPWFLKMGARDEAGPGSSARVQEVMKTARNMLRDRDMHMAFDPKNLLEASDAPYRLVSVRDGEYAGEQVLELTFDCGAEPAKVIITSGSGNAAREITRAAGSGTVHASRPVGGWLISVVGTNAPDGLLSLLEAAPPASDASSIPAAETPQAGMSAPISTADPAEGSTPAPETALGVAPGAVQPIPETPIQPEQPTPPATANPEQVKASAQPSPLT